MAGSLDSWRSKLSTKFRKQDIESWDAGLKARLKALKSRVENRRCFDCGVEDVTWASPKLGIFICVACSDVHRAAGAHITCVKNFNTYLWGPDEVALMTAVGNKRGRDLYGQEMVSPSADKNSKVAACTRKYGNASVQQIVQTEAANAKAIGANGPSVFGTTETSALHPNSQVSHGKEIGAIGKRVKAHTGISQIETLPCQAHFQAEAGPVLDIFDDFFNSEPTTVPKDEQCGQNSTSNLFASNIACVPLPKDLPNNKQDSLEDFLTRCNARDQKLATEISAEENFFAGWESWN